jgi:hypothetical protein
VLEQIGYRRREQRGEFLVRWQFCERGPSATLAKRGNPLSRTHAQLMNRRTFKPS